MKRLLIAALVAALFLLGSWPVPAQDASSQDYAKAKLCYKQLVGPEGKAAPKKEWEGCIATFDKVYERYPDGVKASNALYSASRLREGLYDKTRAKSDLEAAAKSYNRLIHEHPESTLADDALYRMGVLRRDDFKQPDRARTAFEFILEKYPDGDMAPKAKQALAEMKKAKVEKQAEAEVQVEDKGEAKVEVEVEAKTKTEATAGKMEGERDPVMAPAATPAAAAPRSSEATGQAVLSAIDVREAGGVTVVRFSFDRPVEYAIEFTEFGARTQSPPELTLSLLHTVFGAGVEREKLVDSSSLESFTIRKRKISGGLKASFRMTPGAEYDVRRAENAITVRFGQRTQLKSFDDRGGRKHSPGKPGGSLSSFRIVIDPGHGGSESGAVGPGGTLEKDVTLAIARQLAADLKARTRAQVSLTRTTDRTLSLDARNAIAVSRKADLFISIHANAAEEPGQSGFETYYLNNATDEAAARLARRENRSAQKKLSQVEHIISTMLMNYDTEESQALAEDVQGTLKARLGKVNKKARDRGVRSALFYVLVGAKCPAILVETSFISNPREEKLLRSGRYQSDVADAIGDGVSRYLRQVDRRLVSL